MSATDAGDTCGSKRALRCLSAGLALCGLLLAVSVRAESSLPDLDLEGLLAAPVDGESVLTSDPVFGASKYVQKQDRVAASVSIITRDEIKAFGWQTLDEVLASLPGTHHTYDRQYSYFGVRGFGLPGDYTTRVLVTIDGNRINDPVYDGAPTGRLLPVDLGLVERIEFIPGPGGAIYGQNAMLGVINIVTRSGATVGGAETSVSWQWPQAARTARATWGKRLENDLDVVVSASVMRARGEDHFFDFGASGVRGKARGMDEERDDKFHLRLGRGPWALEVLHGDRRKDDPTGAFISDPLVRGQFQQDRSTIAQFAFDDTLSDTLSLSARAFAGSYRYDSELVYDGARFAFPAVGDWHGAELRLMSSALAGHTLMAGVEYHRSTRVRQHVIDLASPGNDVAVDSAGSRIGFYAQDEWRPSDALAVTAGLRIDHNDTTGTELSPRLGLIWHAGPTTLKALYGRAHRAPNAYERDYEDGETQAGNRSLEGERIDTLELVADHEVSRDFRLRASAYRWELNDFIGLGTDPVSGLAQYQSIGKVTAKGLELSAAQLWSRGARLRGSVALQATRDEAGNALVNSPHVLGKLLFSTPVPATRMRLGYELHYDGERRSGHDTLASYWRSNLHLMAERWVKGLEVSLSVLNLFDRRYDHPADAPRLNWQPSFEQDGRSVRLTLDYRF